jgi:dephospho-CoA kinase
MLKVGLTGGIACGKTVVRRMLAGRGAFTIDADEIVHRLMGPGTELSREIGAEFGREVLSSDGSVDRAKLGTLAFSSPEIRHRLNQLVHPRVIEEEQQQLENAKRNGQPIAVVDAALMIEAGTYSEYDCLLVVYCPRSLQIERLVTRDGYSEVEAAQRVDAQLPVEKKKQYADYVIDTSRTLEDTKRQVDEIWKQLQARLHESPN